MVNWKDRVQAEAFLAELRAISQTVLDELAVDRQTLQRSFSLFENYKKILAERIEEYGRGYFFTPGFALHGAWEIFIPRQARMHLLRVGETMLVRALDDCQKWIEDSGQ